MKELTGLPQFFFLRRAGIRFDKFIDWKNRYGKLNEHNGFIPRDHELEEWERQKIVSYYLDHTTDGYRRCTYMMIDEDIVYCSPSTVYRVLKEADVLRSWNRSPSKKGTGFEQPGAPHEHWHTDISYIKIMGVYYYLICVLDGYSRSIIHWDIRESMCDSDVGIVQQKAIEKFPDAKPRFITDNGKQFTGREFKGFISEHGLTHLTTSVCYPQSNGKLERFHQSIKVECIRKKVPLNILDAKRIVDKYIAYYNQERLHSSIGYVSPKDKLEGRSELIQRQRDYKLEKRRYQRLQIRQKAKTDLSVLDKNKSLSLKKHDKYEAV